jgi:DNA topoisomerase 2-associated protein PAT1
MNNLAMHPGFANMPAHMAQMQHPRIPFPMQPQANFIPNIQTNQFNKRLVQEIQQNHPMLPFNRQNNHNKQQPMHNHRNNGMVGNNTDEYANMMTNREKQWLIGIQLQQLNSDTPYLDDFYYTAWKERMAELRGDRESKAYKDNQLNHPFTQPKGHAQMLLMSSLAKNCGMLNQKNGRERRNSETATKNNNEGREGRTYTPLQFENSLGKLQCGSVTAPRKIIDMDCVGNEANANNPNSEISTQRKSKQVLLNIEALYKIMLKMEDLRNPVAIEANLLAKQRKEKEKEQKMLEMLSNGEGDGTQRLENDPTEEMEPTFDELMATGMKEA